MFKKILLLSLLSIIINVPHKAPLREYSPVDFPVKKRQLQLKDKTKVKIILSPDVSLSHKKLSIKETVSWKTISEQQKIFNHHDSIQWIIQFRIKCCYSIQ